MRHARIDIAQYSLRRCLYYYYYWNSTYIFHIYFYFIWNRAKERIKNQKMWAQVPEIEKNSSVHESYRRIKVKFLLHFLIFSSCLKSLIISYYKDKTNCYFINMFILLSIYVHNLSFEYISLVLIFFKNRSCKWPKILLFTVLNIIQH